MGRAGRHHWQMMSVAPESLHCFTISKKYCFSVSRRESNFSTVSMSTCRSHSERTQLHSSHIVYQDSANICRPIHAGYVSRQDDLNNTKHTLCFVLGFGGSKGHVRIAILAFSILFGICGWLMSLSMTMPFTSFASSSLPPTFPSTCIEMTLLVLDLKLPIKLCCSA